MISHFLTAPLETYFTAFTLFIRCQLIAFKYTFSNVIIHEIKNIVLPLNNVTIYKRTFRVTSFMTTRIMYS